MNDMTLTTPPPGISPADYEAIEQAVMETARGRWFLLEYARRQRAAETERLARAIDRLENLFAHAPLPAAPEPPQPAGDPDQAAIAVAERISDIVWTMRERGVGDQFCVELEKQIQAIRNLRVGISAGRPAEPEPRLPAPEPEPQPASLASPPPAPAEPQPAPAPEPQLRLSAPPAAAPEPPRAVDARVAAFARIDAMPTSAKLALFC